MTPYGSEFLGIVLIHFLAVISPGPDFAVVIRQSVRHGRRVGIWTALGIGAGISIHVLYTLVGISALMRATPWAMTAARWAGAAYLLWLGIRFVRSAPPTPQDVAVQGPTQGAPVGDAPAGMMPEAASVPMPEPSARRAFWVGFMTNATNPKATLFFLAVFTTVVSPATPLWVQGLYGLWMCAATAAWFVVVSLLFSRQAVRQRFLAYGHWFERIMGVLLLAFALKLFLS